jgi:hypothetical protein
MAILATLRTPQLSYRFEPHTSATCYAPLEHLAALQLGFTDQSDEAATVRGEIALQSRKTVASKEALIIDPEGTRVPSRRWRMSAPARGV